MEDREICEFTLFHLTPSNFCLFSSPFFFLNNLKFWRLENISKSYHLRSFMIFLCVETKLQFSLFFSITAFCDDKKHWSDWSKRLQEGYVSHVKKSSMEGFKQYLKLFGSTES